MQRLIDEDAAGAVFVHHAGAILGAALVDAGWYLDDVALTNAIRCRPPENATPTIGEIRACRPYLLAELERWKAPVVVGLGVAAVRSLTNLGNLQIKDVRLRDLDIPDLGYRPGWVTATYHPAWVIHTVQGPRGEFGVDYYRSSEQYTQLVGDLGFIRERSEGTSPAQGGITTAAITPAALRKLVDKVKDGTWCSFDFEFDEDNVIQSVGLTFDGRMGYYMGVHHPDTPHTPKEAIDAVGYLVSRAFLWISHRLNTEMVQCFRLGLRVNDDAGVHCTLVGIQFEDENAPNKDLEFWAIKLGLPDYAKEVKPYKKRDVANFARNAPLVMVGPYNAWDSISAWRLAKWQRSRRSSQ